MAGKTQPGGRPYVQFSKRMVTVIVGSAIAVTVLAIVLCAIAGAADTSGVVAVVQSYIGFAMLAFSAYSGNSAVEKWLLQKYAGGSTTVDTGKTESNG